MLLLDEKKAGFRRDAMMKALQAEGVNAAVWDYPEQHKMKIYSEARWWHHVSRILESMPGNAEVNKARIFLPILHGEAAELIDQWGPVTSRRSGLIGANWRGSDAGRAGPQSWYL